MYNNKEFRFLALSRGQLSSDTWK